MLLILQALLLVGTGLAHIGLFFINSDSPTRIPVGAFGVVYLGVGLWSLLSPAGASPPVIAGAVACGIGFVLGFGGAVLSGFTAFGSFLLAVDVAIVVLGYLVLR